MTPATTRLVDLIDRLAEDLRKSQKAETAEFFATLKHRVQEASDVDELRRVLAEIRRMGAISQYAGFSHRQMRCCLRFIPKRFPSIRFLLRDGFISVARFPLASPVTRRLRGHPPRQCPTVRAVAPRPGRLRLSGLS